MSFECFKSFFCSFCPIFQTIVLLGGLFWLKSVFLIVSVTIPIDLFCCGKLVKLRKILYQFYLFLTTFRTDAEVIFVSPLLLLVQMIGKNG